MKTIALFSGRVVKLVAKKRVAPRARRAGAPLFSEAADLVRDGDVAIEERGAEVDVATLELRDFHAFRAIATRLRWLEEEAVEIPCRNCEHTIRHAPCSALPLGPFEDRELHDPELDKTLDLSVTHAVPEIRLGAGAVALDVTLEQVTVAKAMPLHRALRRRRLAVTVPVVRGMGIAALGRERRPERIAKALSACSEKAWATITDLFLLAHYPPRLFSIAKCPACGARNDVDAPFEREFEPADLPLLSPFHAKSNEEHPRGAPADALPSFDEFSRVSREAAREILGDDEARVTFVVEGGVPACDDGGEPLLGSYVPHDPGDATTPTRSAEITVFYRTFRAMWDEEGPYDWRAELRETIEHEHEHHEAFLRGHDPMDEEEREAIARETARIVGKKAIVRHETTALGRDIAGFLRRTWPLWIVLVVITALMAFSSR